MTNKRRAVVPGDVFGQKGSALDKLTGRAPAGQDTSEEHSNTVLPQNRTDLEPREKLSVYLRPDQVDKLDELAQAYRRQTKKRISRVEVVRRLIDASDLQMLLEV
jgi:hypothetical protein